MFDVESLVFIALENGLSYLSSNTNSIFNFFNYNNISDEDIEDFIPFNDVYLNTQLYLDFKTDIQNKFIYNNGYRYYFKFFTRNIKWIIENIPVFEEFNFNYRQTSNRDSLYELKNNINSIKNDLNTLFNTYEGNNIMGIFNDDGFKSYWTESKANDLLMCVALTICVIYYWLKPNYSFIFFNLKNPLNNSQANFGFEQIPEDVIESLPPLSVVVYNQWGCFDRVIFKENISIVLNLDYNIDTESYVSLKLLDNSSLNPFDIIFIPSLDITYNAFIVDKKLNKTDYEAVHLLDFHYKIHTPKVVSGGSKNVCDWLSDIIWFDNASTATPVPYISNQNPSTFTLKDYVKFLYDRGYYPYLKFKNPLDYRVMVLDERIEPKLLKYDFSSFDIFKIDETFGIDSKQGFVKTDQTEFTAWEEQYRFNVDITNPNSCNDGTGCQFCDDNGLINPEGWYIAAGNGKWNFVNATQEEPAHYDGARRLSCFNSELYKRGALWHLDPYLVQEKNSFQGKWLVDINSTKSSLPQMDTVENQDNYWRATRYTNRRSTYDSLKDKSRSNYDFTLSKKDLELSLVDYFKAKNSDNIRLNDLVYLKEKRKEYILPINKISIDYQNMNNSKVSVG
ncbi:MAG: hypothetical protein CfClM3_0606 [Methanobrevibacter sp. CfCl-M3]